MAQTKVKKINGSEITEPYYPGDSKCVYCEGETSVFKTKFEVYLKNQIVIKPVCTICLNEVILEHPPEVDTIKNIGEW